MNPKDVEKLRTSKVRKEVLRCTIAAPLHMSTCIIKSISQDGKTGYGHNGSTVNLQNVPLWCFSVVRTLPIEEAWKDVIKESAK